MDRKSDKGGIRIAESDAEIARCYAVMAELRTHVRPEQFVPRVRRQMQAGYRLAWAEDEGNVVAVAGYRISEGLFHGKFMYVDDLVTSTNCRSRGHGKRLFDWLVKHAREQDCASLDLDSGVQRFEAHRFYLREGMQIRSHHFSLALDAAGESRK